MLKKLTQKFYDTVRESWDENYNQAIVPVKQDPVHILPHQKDTIASAKEESTISTKKLPNNQVANPYYQDTQSTYSDTAGVQNKITTINPPSLQKHVQANDSSVALNQLIETDSSKAPVSKGIEFEVAKDLVKENYKKSLEKAGEETRLAIEQTKTDSSGAPRILDARLEELSRKIDEELQKDNIQFDVLQAMVLKIVMLHMRRTARVEHEFTSEQGLRIKVRAIEVKNAYTSWTGLAVAFTSAAVSIVGGGAGLAPFAGSMITAQTAQTLVTASQPLSNTSMGINSLSGIVSAKDSSNKGYLEFHLRLDQTKEENAKERKRSNGEVIKRVKELVEEVFRNLHQLFSNFCSPNG